MDIENIKSSVSETNSGSNLPNASTIILLLTIISSVTISLADLGASGADVAVDAATVGTVGVATGFADLGIELVSEAIQNIIITVAILYFSGVRNIWSWLLIALVVSMSLIDIVLTIVEIPLPYFDIIKLITEMFTELIQNGVLIGLFINNLGK